MNKFIISQEDLSALKRQDKFLAAFIDSVDVPKRYYSKTLYKEIVKTVIGQLISTKAADTIYQRLEELLGEVNETNFLNADKVAVIKCGISERKYGYITNLSYDLKYGILDFQELENKSDDEVIKLLCNYPGIGEWSAEMILMHGLLREDVLSFNDLGIRKGICKVYGLEDLSRSEFKEIKQRISPYGTIASLYFWKAYSGE